MQKLHIVILASACLGLSSTMSWAVGIEAKEAHHCVEVDSPVNDTWICEIDVYDDLNDQFLFNWYSSEVYSPQECDDLETYCNQWE